MNNQPEQCRVSEEDLRAALREMKTYVDVTEEDLKKIFEIALRHAQERMASRIPVRDVMTRSVVTIKRDADLHEAARILSENRISGMPVVDDNNRVIGVVSEADILILAGLKREHTFKDILRNILGEPVTAKKGGDKVGDVMGFPPISSKAVDDIGEVAMFLVYLSISCLRVEEADGKLIGMISRADFFMVICQYS